MDTKEFVEFVARECKYYGIDFKPRNSSYVIYDGFKAGGLFSSEDKFLMCAMKRPDALQILAHEYCHLTQWAQKAEVWVISDETKSYQAWNEHLEGKAVPNMDTHFNVMRNLELDNEKRTVKLIKKLGLPINIEEYIKRANAYMMFYNWMREGGEWASGNKAPYKCQRLVDAMPSKFSMNYNKLPARIEKIFVEEGYKRR